MADGRHHDEGAVLALIPARAGSKGVPGKNIRRLGELPLLAYAIRAAARTESIARIIVSTDSPAIAEIAGAYGADTPFLRPADCAQDDSPMAAVVAHALAWLRDHERYEPAIVVLLQPTAPFRTAEQIETAIRWLREQPVDSVVSVSPVPDAYHPEWQYRVREGLLASYHGRPVAETVTRRQALETTYFRNGLVYAFKAASFWRTGSFYGESTRAYIVPAREIVNIDTQDDWEAAEAVLARGAWSEA